MPYHTCLVWHLSKTIIIGSQTRANWRDPTSLYMQKCIMLTFIFSHRLCHPLIYLLTHEIPWQRPVPEQELTAYNIFFFFLDVNPHSTTTIHLTAVHNSSQILYRCCRSPIPMKVWHPKRVLTSSFSPAISTFVGSRPSDHYFRSVCWFVCLSVCLFVQFFSAIFDPISIKLGHMLYVSV